LIEFAEIAFPGLSKPARTTDTESTSVECMERVIGDMVVPKDSSVVIELVNSGNLVPPTASAR
jgi:hypothetical protein